MSVIYIYGFDGQGDPITDPPPKGTKVEPDPNNYDSTDFPRFGCRNCGRRDRPQWRGTCNDDSCCSWE